jgi:predicted nuclease with TOPRIM domain
MDDREVVQHIDELVAEEHRLRDHSTAGQPLTDADRERLGEIEVRLDQLWDLLRRRKAREEFDEDPDTETLRPPGVVEGYQQ